jgi:hypothetical protein
MSSFNSRSQHATVSDHLDTLKKLAKFTTEANNDNEKQLEELEKQLEDLRRKVHSQKKTCEKSKKRMHDAKMVLEEAEKTHEVIDLASEDEIKGEEQTRSKKESPYGKRRRSMLTASPASTSAFRMSVGRTREQLNKSVDVGRCLSGSKFSMSCFGTQTIHTGMTKITFLVLNDEWNKLVTSSAAHQMLYVGTGPNKKKFGLALAEESEAIPFFHAPKKSKNTCDIFYVGHWKSVCYIAYDPPIDFMGKPRQTLIRLQFVRYDETLDSAIAAS